MRTLSCIAFLLFALAPFCLGADLSSQNYNFLSTTISSGGSNTSSSSYSQGIAIGIISGIFESSSYINSLGFFHTILLANGQPCTTANQCEGGYCCSNLCASSACASGTSVSSSGGGGAGGGGGGTSNITRTPRQAPIADFYLNTSLIHLEMMLGDTTNTTFLLINNGTTPLDGNLSIIGIEDFLNITPNLFASLSAQDSLDATLFALGRRVGSHLGEVRAESGNLTRSLDVLLDISSGSSLFDVSLDIPSQYKRIQPKEKLLAQITLFNVGAAQSVPVQVTYLIKDTKGSVISEESEEFLVDGERSYVHEFETQELEFGKHLASIEIRYGTSFAVASDTFMVAPKAINPVLGLIAKNTTFFIALAALSAILYVAISAFMKPKQPKKKKGQKQKK
ncbi:MAG TPA: hypothetical protein VJB12_06055 [Candidatus Nanoarchaeia archaeon]|nr:hypothetical protein [Candidatus Nanoarchaeia archaeon]